MFPYKVSSSSMLYFLWSGFGTSILITFSFCTLPISPGKFIKSSALFSVSSSLYLLFSSYPQSFPIVLTLLASNIFLNNYVGSSASPNVVFPLDLWHCGCIPCVYSFGDTVGQVWLLINALINLFFTPNTKKKGPLLVNTLCYIFLSPGVVPY